MDTDEKISAAMQADVVSIDKTRFINVTSSDPLQVQLSKYHGRSVIKCFVKSRPKSLHCQDRSTILVEIVTGNQAASYQPGDHVGIFAENRPDIVNGVIKRLTGVTDWDATVQLQILKEHHTSNGTFT